MAYHAYITIQHPKSGETYAAEVETEGITWTSIIRAAGPLHHSDPRNPQALKDYLDNQPAEETEGDAHWLALELEPYPHA